MYSVEWCTGNNYGGGGRENREDVRNSKFVEKMIILSAAKGAEVQGVVFEDGGRG